MKKLAVIGHPIKHSLSPIIHNIYAKELKIDLSYEIIEINPSNFEYEIYDIIKNYDGFNISLPFKKDIVKFADVLSNTVNKSLSANTFVKINSKNYLYNTDGIGLIESLLEITSLDNKNILILGSGGASFAVIYDLFLKGIKNLSLYARNEESKSSLIKNYSNIGLDTSIEFDIVINATSSSINLKNPLPDDLKIRADAIFYDMFYSKEITFTNNIALSYGFKTFDGLSMLINQARHAFYHFTGIMPDKKILTTNILREFI